MQWTTHWNIYTLFTFNTHGYDVLGSAWSSGTYALYIDQAIGQFLLIVAVKCGPVEHQSSTIQVRSAHVPIDVSLELLRRTWWTVAR